MAAHGLFVALEDAASQVLSWHEALSGIFGFVSLVAWICLLVCRAPLSAGGGTGSV